MAGGAAGILVADCPVHMGDGAPGSHILWAAVGLAALAVWPAAASHRGPAEPWTLHPEVSVRLAVLLLILLAWFGMELITSGGLAGLAERAPGVAQSAWPFVVVISCRHRVPARQRSHRGYRGSPWARAGHGRTSKRTSGPLASDPADQTVADRRVLG